MTEREVEDVLGRPAEDRPGIEGFRVAIGQTHGGRFLKVIFVPDPEPGSVFVITAYELRGCAAGHFPPPETQETAMTQNRFPPGWDEARVQRTLAYYEEQSEEQAVADDEAALESPGQTVMEVPSELVPAIRELIAKHHG